MINVQEIEDCIHRVCEQQEYNLSRNAKSMFQNEDVDTKAANKTFHPEMIASGGQYETYISNRTDSPLGVGMEVEVHLRDHNPIKEKVKCTSNEEGTMALKKLQFVIGRSKRREHTQTLLGSSLQTVSPTLGPVGLVL